MPETLCQLSENVWIFPHDKNPQKIQPNVGIICTPTQTVVIDSGNSPRRARSILAALESIDAPPVSHVIYTHHHWDHISGACAFGVPVIAHDLCKELLAARALLPWSHNYIREQIQRNPLLKASYETMDQAIENWNDFQIILPDTTFSQTLNLQLDGVTLELEHVGGHHASDSIVVRVKERGVMFLGDCYYPPPRSQQGNSHKVSWSMLLSFLEEKAINTYVDGHADPFSSSDMFKRWGVKFLARIQREREGQFRQPKD